ncbi:hypothetical protein SELMODRAFT_31516, partial [Selaginella moellendorffii]
GIKPDVFVLSSAMGAYARCGQIDRAREIFDAMETRDPASWTAIISAYAQQGDPALAMELYWRMNLEGMEPNRLTYVSLLGGCASLGALDHGKSIYSRFLARGFQADLMIQSALLNLHSKCGSLEDARAQFATITDRDAAAWTSMIEASARHGRIEEARAVFERMPARTLVGWNAMVVWYARYAIPREALHLFQEMASLDGLEPDVVSCIGALAACASLGYLTEGRAVHRACTARIMTGDDQRRDVVLWTSLVNMYAKCGEIEEASLVFEEMDERNAVSFNAMMAAFAQNGHLDRALGLYRRMICEEGLDADVVTLLCLLVACNHAGLYAQGRDLFVQLRGDHEWIAPAVDHYHCLVDLLSRAGRIDVAEEILVWMPFQPGAIGWKSLLNGCAVHGDPVRGARAAAIACRLDPVDSSQYVLLSNAYA